MDLKNTLINNYYNFNCYNFVVQPANEHYRKLVFLQNLSNYI